jgi:hypothetical protein
MANNTPTKGSKIGCLLLLCLFVIGGIAIFSIEEPKTPEQIEQEKIEVHFSSWDGSHRELVSQLKANLKDPDSFEHIETTYKVQGDSIWVFMNYRAKNSFGGYVVEGITAITDKNSGKVIDVVKQQK